MHYNFSFKDRVGKPDDSVAFQSYKESDNLRTIALQYSIVRSVSGTFNAFNFLDPTVIHIQVPLYMYACYRGEAHVHNIYVYTVGTEQLCADNYSKNAKRAKYVEIVECRAGIEFAGFCETTLISRTHCVSYIGEPFFFLTLASASFPSPSLPFSSFFLPSFLSPAYTARRHRRWVSCIGKGEKGEQGTRF